ncbi:alpha/beta hydrolase [Streptomyces sp. M10(2022)]
MLLHGSGPGVTGWRNYRDNLGALAGHFRCLVLEFPGFGVSDPVDGHPMATAADAVERFLDGLGLHRVDVIGNSMGGIVATRFAIDHPGRVGRLVTIGGIGRNLFSPSPGEGINLLMEFTANPTRDGLVQWLNSMVYDPPWSPRNSSRNGGHRPPTPTPSPPRGRCTGGRRSQPEPPPRPAPTRRRTGRCCTGSRRRH